MANGNGKLGGLRSFWQDNVDVRPQEKGRAWIGFLTLFGLVVSHELLETARHAAFLQRLSADKLPYAYLALAGGAVVWAIVARLLAQRVRTPSLTATLLASTAGIWLLWALHGERGAIYPYVLYLATSLVVPVWMVAYWVRQSGLWTVLEAKRIFAFFALGGLGGNICGAALARTLAERYGVRSLLVAAGIVITATAIFGARRIDAAPPIVPDLEPEAEEEESRDVPKRYVPLLLIIAVFAAVATKLGEFLFLRGVSHRVAPNEVASTLATASLIASVGALVVHFGLARWALRSFGVTRSVAILPTLYAAVAGWSALGSTFRAPMVLRITDGALRQPIYRTAMELLFVPLPARLRQAAKTWVDIVGQRAGQAIASLAILGIAAWVSDEHHAIAIATLLVALLWACLSPLLHRDYVELFRRSLSRGPNRDRAGPTELDHGSIVALLASLEHKDPETVVAAMDMLVDAGAASLLPASLLSRGERPVLLRALEAGPVEARGWIRGARRLLESEDPEVRAGALRFLGTPEAARSLLGDADVRVRVTAFVIAFADSDSHQSQHVVTSFAEGDIETQLALVGAVSAGGAVPPHLEPVLVRLAREGSPVVQEAIAHLATRHPTQSLLSPLIDMVGHASTRAAAREAIAAHGPSALNELRDRLEEDATPPILRRHLPGTIARVGGKRAAQLLLKRYAGEPDDRVRTKLLRGLLSLRRRDPTIPVDDGLLSHSIDRTLARGAQLTRWAGHVYTFLEDAPSYKTPASERLLDVLYEERGHTLDRALALLELVHRGEDYAAVRRNVLRGDAAKRAQAIELLGNVAPLDIRSRLFELCTDEPRLSEGTPVTGLPTGAEVKRYQSLLREIQLHGTDSLRLLATRARDEHPSFAPSLRGRAVEHAASVLPPAETSLWLRKVPLFAHVDPRGIALLAMHVEDRRYPPDAALSSARSLEHTLTVVVSGVLEGPDRAIIESGAVLHESVLFTDDPPPLVVARSETRVLELRVTTLVDLMRDHFDLFLAIARRLAQDAIHRRPQSTPSPLDRGPFDGDGIVERMDVLLRALPFLAGHASSCAQLASACTHELREPGASVVPQDGTCRSISVLMRGQADDVVRGAALGTHALCGLLESLLEVAPPTTRARTDLELLQLSSDDLLDVLEEHAMLQPAFLRFLAHYGDPSRKANSDLAA